MFVIMAVDTEVFPVGTIRRVIQVVPIFVVDGEEVPGLFVKLPSAFGADEAVYLERALSIVTPRRFRFFQFLKGLFNGLVVPRLFRRPMMNSIGFIFHLYSLRYALCPMLFFGSRRQQNLITETLR